MNANGSFKVGGYAPKYANKRPPINDVYIISEWWKTNGDEIKKRPHGSVPAIIPEVMAYYSETNSLYGINILKYIGKL